MIRDAETIRKIQEREMMEGSLTPEETMADKAWGTQIAFDKDENGNVIKDEKGKSHFRLIAATHSQLVEKMARRNKAGVEANRLKAREREIRRIEIQREAINSKLIDINDAIPVEHIRLLIKLLTQDQADAMQKNADYINVRLKRLLCPLIPRSLKRSMILYPKSVVKHPGFIYQASKEYGQGRIFSATPDIVYYFEQGTEMKILRDTYTNQLFSIDKAVVQYCLNKERLSEREIRYAIQLKTLKTYFTLVKKNPVWYDILVQELIRRRNEANKCTP